MSHCLIYKRKDQEKKLTTDDLDKKHCVPCEGGVEPLDMAAAKQISQAIDPAWNISDDGRILRGSSSFPTTLKLFRL